MDSDSSWHHNSAKYYLRSVHANDERARIEDWRMGARVVRKDGMDWGLLSSIRLEGLGNWVATVNEPVLNRFLFKSIRLWLATP